MSITSEEKARFEAAGHEAALLHVETLANQKDPLSQVELLEVHRLIFAQSWPEIAGRFRTERISRSPKRPTPRHTGNKCRPWSIKLSERLATAWQSLVGMT